MGIRKLYFLQSALFILLFFPRDIFRSAATLESSSCARVELGTAELGDVKSLHHHFWYLILALLTAFCCILGLWIVGAVKLLFLVISFCQAFAKRRWKKAGSRSRKSNWAVSRVCSCSCNCGGGKFDYTRLPNGNAAEKFENQQQIACVPQPGASMMEQLVPEITQHMLSYLDYRSLCNVSMTNSCMRRAANDDSAWKAIFHKDFTVEQSCTVAPQGWKAHYAVTKAVLETNRSFYKSFHTKSIKGMRRLWLHSDYVKCIHPGFELLSGYEAVMENWRTVFNWNDKLDFDLQEERVRVFGNMAWVTLKEFINSSAVPMFTTNVYEYCDGHWYMVHRHSSPQLEGGNFEFGQLLN